MAYTAPTTVFAPYFGAFVYFAPKGATIEAVTVASDTKPAGSVLADWEALSCIELMSVNRETEGGEDRKCYEAGSWVKKPTKERLITLSYELTVQDVSEFLHMVSRNAAAIGADGEMTPNSQPEGAYEGWIKIQQEDAGTVVVLDELWVELTMPNSMQIAGASSSTPQLRLEVLTNALNASAVGVAS